MSIKNIVISFFLLFNFYCFASSGDIQNNKNSFLIKNTIMHGAKKIYSFLNHHSLLIGISSLGIGIYYYDKYKNNSSIINFGIQYQTQLATIGSFIISPIYIKWLNQYINDTEYKLMPKAQNFIDSKAIDLAKVIPTNIFELHLNKYKKKIKYIKQYQLKNMRHMSTKAAFNSIIYGPPGSGKTLLIQYLAKNIFSNETHTIYYKNISPTDILRTHISRDIEEIKKLEVD